MNGPQYIASAVRAWAKENGIPVNATGRVPYDLLNAYQAAHLPTVQDSGMVLIGAMARQIRNMPDDQKHLHAAKLAALVKEAVNGTPRLRLVS